MRNETKAKLEKLVRKERWRRLAIWAAVPILFALAAFFLFRPSEYVGSVSGTVERSVIGTSAFGERFHQLNVKLDNNNIVSVNTFVMQPIAGGRIITLARRRGWMGNIFYKLELKPPSQSK